jgi:hypothetical protein
MRVSRDDKHPQWNGRLQRERLGGDLEVADDGHLDFESQESLVVRIVKALPGQADEVRRALQP